MKKLYLFSVMTLTALFFFLTPDSLSAQQTKIPPVKGKTIQQGNRLFHITPEGDTIVSFLNQKQAAAFYQKPTTNRKKQYHKQRLAKRPIESTLRIKFIHPGT